MHSNKTRAQIICYQKTLQTTQEDSNNITEHHILFLSLLFQKKDNL